jgi:hypothetical protein
MKPVLLALLAVSCFREAPPCDPATLERIKATCTSLEDCNAKLDEREGVCEERMKAGE